MFNRIEKLVFDLWWVIAGILLCYGIYERGRFETGKKIRRMEDRLIHVETLIAMAKEEQEDLFMQIQSQHDDEWKELILMRTLGPVPEGFCKIVYYPRS